MHTLVVGTSVFILAFLRPVTAVPDMGNLSYLDGTSPTLYARQTTNNLQTFDQALGGARAPAITQKGDTQRPFAVEGDTFTDLASAAQRSCDDQFNACADIANAARGDRGTFSVSDCNTQKEACIAAQTQTKLQSSTVGAQNLGPDPQLPEFDLICDV